MKNFLTYTLITFSFLFFYSCSTTTNKITLSIDVQYANIYFEGIQNFSELNKLESWPEDSLMNSILYKTINKLEFIMNNELMKNERKGSYKMVDSPINANVIIGLHLLKASLEDTLLLIPVELRVKDKRNNKDFSIAFIAFGSNNLDKIEKINTNFYHYYGNMLYSLIRNFPAWQITSIFNYKKSLSY